MFRTTDLINFIRKYPRRVLLGLISLGFASLILLVVNYLYIGSFSKHITDAESLPAHDSPVAIVFGGGVRNGKPLPLLRDRLDTAAELLESGKARKLLVSGDNRFKNYNEPQAMYNYLTNERHVAGDKIQLDFAGRSTYETCERAKKIFGLDRAILVSETTHLPRAIYTCRSFGVGSVGVASDGQSSAGLKIGQRWREVLARTKATLNIHLVGEPTVLGNKIPL